MNPKSMMKYKDRATKLFNELKESPTAVKLFNRFNGATAQQAYDELKKLNDDDLRALAVIIGRANAAFNSGKE